MLLLKITSRESVKLLPTYEESGTIVTLIVALAALADRAVYPIVLAIDATELLFTAESRNASFAVMCANIAL